MNIDDKMFSRRQAIIRSMTMQERLNPNLLNASRKRRIAKGSGVDTAEVNRLLKQYKQSKMALKKVGKLKNSKNFDMKLDSLLK